MDLLAMGSVVAGRYRIVSELGRGGMGVVYLVQHVHTGQELALKVLSLSGALTSEAVERFKREARAPARIKSENVVTVTDADVLPERGGLPFFVMERLRGRDLEAEVRHRRKLPPGDVIELLTQAARALDRSHALGIIHRDLKPENLFLHERDDGTRCLKILDFGISKTLEDADGARAISLTGPGSLMGTPLYMSPEQARAHAPVTKATDLWSLGLVAVRLLTGECYWRTSSLAELMVSLLREPLYCPTSRWPWLPKSFDAWFARACSRDPEDRFATALEQIASLARVFDEAPPAGPDRSDSRGELATPTPQFSSMRGRRRRGAVAAFLSAGTLVVIGWVVVRAASLRESSAMEGRVSVTTMDAATTASAPAAMASAAFGSPSRIDASSQAPLPSAPTALVRSTTTRRGARPDAPHPSSSPTHDPVAP